MSTTMAARTQHGEQEWYCSDEKKMGEPERQGMLGKHLGANGRYRFVALFGCVLSVMSCAGCGSSSSQSASVLAKVLPAARVEDYKATGEYLRARSELISTTVAALPLDSSSAEAAIAHARSECAGALRGTPAMAVVDGRLEAKAQVALPTVALLIQIEGSVLGRYTAESGRAVTASAARRFAAKVATLQWADSRVTHLARALVGVEAQLFADPSVDVCRVIKNWAASGYRTAAGTEESLQPHGVVGRAWQLALRAVGCRRADPSVQPDEKTMLAVLHPYERPGSTLTTRHIEEMEAHLGVAIERSERGRVEGLMRVLGLSPPPRKSVKRKLTVASPLPDCVSPS